MKTIIDRIYDTLSCGLTELLNIGTTVDTISASINSESFAYVEGLISNQYGQQVSVADKSKILIKYGRNQDINTDVEETVWETGGIPTYPVGNTIDEIVSTDLGDNQVVTIEGHTVDGSGNFTFVTQTAILNGTAPVPLTTPLARASRAYNSGSTDFAGIVTIYESAGPTTHITIPVGENQSLNAATTISNQDYFIINELMVSVNRANSAIVDFKLKIREKGGVFRTMYALSASSSSGTVYIDFGRTPIIVPPNSDIRIDATSDSINTQVEAAVHGYLAIVTV